MAKFMVHTNEKGRVGVHCSSMYKKVELELWNFVHSFLKSYR